MGSERTSPYIVDPVAALINLATDDIKPIRFYCRTGGNVMSPEDIVAFIKGEN